MSEITLSKNLESYYQKGLAAIEKNNFDYAIELLIQVVQDEPLHAPSRKALRLAERSRADEASISKLSLFLLKMNSLLPLIMALIYESFKKPRKALAFYEEALKYFPNDLSILKKIASISIKQNWLDVSILAYEDIIEVNSEDVGSMKRLGYLYKQKGSVGNAKKYFSRVLETQPNDQELKKDFKDLEAISTIQDGKWDDNQSYRSKVKDGQPSTEKAGDAEAASEEDAIDPLEQSLMETRKKLKEDPTNEALKAELAKLEGEKVGQNIQKIEEQVASYPNDLNLRFELGSLLLEKGDYDQAISQFQLSVKDPAKLIPSLHRLGLCFKSKQMYDLAVVQFQKALEKDPVMKDTTKNTIYNLGETFELMGKKDEAFDQYKKIYEVDISYRDVAQKIDQHYKGE